MKTIKTCFSRLVLVVSVALVVTACGGGDGGESSSGQGATNNAGTYVGPFRFTLSGLGQTESASGLITIRIDADGSVVLDPGSGFEGTGRISGNVVTASYPGSIANGPGISCSGTLPVKGTVSGSTITGTISSSGFRCNGQSFTVTGSFTVSRNAKSLASSDGLGEALKRAVSR